MLLPWLVPFIFLMVVALGHAQTPPSSYAVSGVVNDTSGAAIVGARVVLLDGGGQTSGAVATDHSGAFRFDGLRPGSYKLVVTEEGFRQSTTAVGLEAKRRVSVPVVLAIGVVSQEVTVGQGGFPEVTTEIAGNQGSNTLDREALDRVPAFDQDYIATLSRFLDDSSIGTNGVSLIVNGLESNGLGVTSSAIQEVKINQNPFSALFSRPGRARLEVITKGGTPDFHGSVNFLFRDAIFDARNALASVKAPELRSYFEGSITGPVGHGKKTTFLLSLDRDQQDQQAIVVAAGPAGVIQQNVATPMRHFFASGRIFHDIGQNDQVWVGYSYEDRRFTNQNVGGTVLPEAGSDYESFEHEINVSYRHVFSAKTLNQVRFLLGHEDQTTTSISHLPQIVVPNAFTAGGAQADGKRTEYHFEGNDILTAVRGQHEWKFGVEIPDFSRRGADDFTNFGGTYYFNTVADYAAGRPFLYTVQRGQGHLVFYEKNVAGIVEDTVRVRPNLSVSLGLRYYFQNYFNSVHDNFAPRLGFAYAPRAHGKTVIRGGGGIFYDRSGPRPIADLLHFNGVRLQKLIVQDPAFPADPASLAAQPGSVVVLDPAVRIPYTVQYSIGIERQFAAKSTLSVSYVGARGIGLFRSRDLNAPFPPLYTARPDPARGQVRQIESTGYQKSNALEVTFRGRATRFFTGQAQYTLSKTNNNTSGVNYFPGSSFFPALDWARADTDRRHKFDMLGSVAAGNLFKLGMALSLYSGTPVNVTTGLDDNHDGVVNDRPIGEPRNTLHGPGRATLDLSLSHEFRLSKSHKEGRSLVATLNSFNVANHRNDVTYVGSLNSPFFGQAVAAQPPRRMQINLEFKF